MFTPGRHRAGAATAAALLVLLCRVGHADTELVFDVGVNAGFDSNVGSARSEVKSESDLFSGAIASINLAHTLSPRNAVLLRGYVSHQRFQEFGRLDDVTVGAKVAYQFVNSATFSAPTYTVFVSYENADFVSDMRDSRIGVVGLEASAWLAEHLNLTTGASARRRIADSAVFDTDEVRFFANLDYWRSQGTVLYTTAALHVGDVVSSGPASLSLVKVADAIQPDDAFGGVNVTPFQAAYRLGASTALLTVGANTSLNRHLTLDLSARGVYGNAAGGTEYTRYILQLSLFGRF